MTSPPSISRRISLAAFSAAAALCGSVCAAPPTAPSGLEFISTSPLGAKITWADNSSDEDGFEIQIRFDDDTEWYRERLVTADVTSQTYDSGFTAEVPIHFRVRSGKDGDPSTEWSDFSNELSVTTQNYHIQASCITLTPGQDFTRTITTNFGVVPALLSTLPPSMAWEPTTGTLSGTAVPTGTFPLEFEAASGVHNRQRTFFVQAINVPPVVAAPLENVSIVAQPGTTPTQSIDLSSTFADPDISRSAIIHTSAGPVPVGFYAGAPLTVANFFAYADSDAWDGSFFHRSAHNFVIQGGGYRPDGSGDFETIPDLPPVPNEFDATRSNVCGTIAMAKLGNDPDSATNEFFFSINDNANNLDNQNGGFTVFGRATDMTAVDLIASYRTDSYSITLDGSSQSFSDWPLESFDASSPLPSQLASINDVVEIDPLSWTATSSNPSVASVNSAGGGISEALLITPTGSPGQTEIVVTSNDLDSAAVSTSFLVTLSNSYAAWIADENIAPKPEGLTDRPGGGPFNNLQSYAFGGAAADGTDDHLHAPATTTADVETVPHDALCFYHRKYASDLSYRVETTTDLVTWSTVWETADGNDAPIVVSAVDDGDFWKITVRKDTPAADDDAVYFRVAVTHPGN